MKCLRKRAPGARALLAAALAVAASALPAVRFDHPTQDFEFAPAAAGARADVFLVVQALADPAWRASGYEQRLAQWEGGRWDLAIDINAHEVGRWRATELINGLGEVSAHVSVPDLPAGEHVASCRLEPRGGAPDGLDPPEHTISFFVRDSPRPAPAPPDAWTPPLCRRCAQAVSCSSASSKGDMGGATRKGGGEGEGAALLDDVCSGHGVCQNGACLCAAGWAGEACDHDILRHASFLPDVDPALAPSRCAKSLAWELDAARLEELLEEVLPWDASQCAVRARGAACRPGAPGPTCTVAADTHDGAEGQKQDSGMLDGILLFGPPTHGLGFNVHYVSHMVAWAAERGLVPALVETPALGAWPYGHIPACAASRQGWTCMLEPLSACHSFAQRAVNAEGAHVPGEGGADLDERSFASVPPSSEDAPSSRGVGREGQGSSSSSSSRRRSSSSKVHSRADGIPKVALQPPPVVRGHVLGVPTHGGLWWRAQLVRRIMRPSPLLLRMLRSVRNGLGLSGPYISVHVRMGDSCTHTARFFSAGSSAPAHGGCVGVAEYVQAALRMAAQYNISQVYLATDSSEAVQAFEGTGLAVRCLALDRASLFDSSWLIEHRMQAKVLDVSAVTESAAVDLFLLAEGDMFVGAFGGHMSRLAFELLVGLRGRVVPYVSVDRAWCFESDLEYGTGFIDFC